MENWDTCVEEKKRDEKKKKKKKRKEEVVWMKKKKSVKGKNKIRNKKQEIKIEKFYYNIFTILS